MANNNTDQYLENNKKYASGQAVHKAAYPGKQPINPDRHVAVVACDVDTGKLEEVGYPGTMGTFG